jgi:hypothetical protein
MTSPSIPAVVRWLWAGAALALVGLAYDLRWHAAHDQFETAADQVEAHWLSWAGLAVVLVVSTTALVGLPAGRRPPVLVFVAAAAGARAVVTVWHFLEHLNERDPALPHILLGVSEAAVLVGIVLVSVQARRREPRRAADLA